jgi:hypothetical protein
MQETLRDRNGKIIGTIRESGGTMKLYSVGGRMLGSYNKSSNITKNAGGTVIATAGNLLVSLLK